jgi:hypothetical protein
MRIAILTICTGKYTIFFDGFYNSIKHNFLTDIQKTFYVFTDGDVKNGEDVIRIEQKKLGWPYDTMFRFKMFNRISEQLNQYDYLFFLNANMLVSEQIDVSILPGIENDNLIGVIHPGFYNSEKQLFPYERRGESSLFINQNEGRYYFQGCLNGGKSHDFLNMSSILDKKIEEDLKNGIIPIWHDESALNWYYKDKNVLAVNPGYAYPESWNIPFVKKIIQLDKNKWGGHQYLRN